MIILNFFSDWVKNNPDVSVALITITGSVLGFLATRIYDRNYADKFSSSSELLEKLERQTLSYKGKKRLLDELNGAILNLQSEFKNNRERLHNTTNISEGHRFFAKEITTDTNATNCPTDSQNCCYLIFDTENYSQDAIYDFGGFLGILNDKFSNSLSKTVLQLFKNRKIISEELKIFFWVNAENYFPENEAKLNAEYNSLTEVVTRWIPGSSVIVELYVPSDLKTAKSFVNSPQIMLQFGDYKNKFGELILDRNRMYKQFGEGYVFGKLGYVHREIPLDVMQSRFNVVEKLVESEVLNIYGGPGTGKTFLTDYLINQKSKTKNLFIILNNIELMNSWISLIKLNTKDAFLNSIINVLFESHSNLFPDYSTKSDNTIKQAKFILKNLLNSDSINLYIVIDDYYLYKDTIESAVSALIEKKWRVRFILVGRPEIIELKSKFPDRVKEYKCDNWTMNDALKIIRQWTDQDTTKITDALKIDWLVSKNEFSIYLLRLIANNIDNIENYTLSEILRKEITNSIAPVFAKLVGNQSKHKVSNTEIRNSLEKIISIQNSDSLKIERIRDLLDKEVDITIDKFIRKIGELCWASKFKVAEDDASLTDKGISDELITDLFPFLELTQFRKIGMEAKIFKRNSSNEGKLDWNDNLISEGSLALLVKDDLNNISSDAKKQLEFSGLLEGLKKENSLNILSLILDGNAILKMAKIISNTNLDRLDLVDDLLTEQNLNLLQKSKNGIGSLALSLIEGFSKGENEKEVDKIAKLVKKISEFDNNYKNYLIEIMVQDTLEGRIARYAIALSMNSPAEFLIQMDIKGIDKFRSTEIITSISKKVDVQKLVSRLNSIEKSDTPDLANIKLVWKTFLEKFDSITVLEIADAIAYSSESNETRVNIKLIDLTLNYCRENRLVPQKREIKEKIHSLLVKTWVKKRFRYSSVIVKYVVFFEAEDVLDLNHEWKVNEKEKYGLPCLPMGKNKVVEILGRMPEMNFRIANTNQILTNSVETFDAFELVSDNLADGNIHQKQLPANFKFVNFKANPIEIDSGKIEDIRREAERVFFWRPVYYF